MNILERWGLYHINRYMGANTYLLHRLPLQQLTRIAIIISFVIGFVITLIVAIADIIFFPELGLVLSSPKLLLFLLLLNLGLIAIEFWLLFHIGFQVVARYISALSYPQLENPQSESPQLENQQFEGQPFIDQQLKISLVRAVLELNEPKVERFGLNPYRKVTKHYWLKILLYKSKVILSNFVAKLIARKLLSRLGLRAYAPLISTIITGWWDAWIQSAVLKEVRFRLSGRLYAIRLTTAVQSASPTQEWLEALLRLVAVRIELFGQYSINLDYIIIQLEQQITGSVKDLTDLFDIKRLQSIYLKLSAREQEKLSHIACLLLAFKHRKLSQEETELLAIFNIDKQCVEQAKEQFNQLFDYKIDEVLVEV